MVIATDGLIQNLGLDVSGNLTLSIDAYTSTEVIDLYTTVLSNAVPIVGNVITSDTFELLQNLAANTLPAVTTAIPSAYAGILGPLGNTVTDGFANVVTSQAEQDMGLGDLSIFAQAYGIAQAYLVQANQYINSAINSNIYNATFVDMNNMTTGSVSQISNNLPVFGQDLIRLGQTWDLENLTYLGYPSALLLQLIKIGGLLPEVVEQLNLAGVDSTSISELRSSGTALAADVEAAMYRGMQAVTGDTLSQVNFLLDVTTPNLTSMADLLNPVKTLPNSYQTLTVSLPTGTDVSPTASVSTTVYQSSNTINSNISILFVNNDVYTDLAKIVPPDQALANQAIILSLRQVKDIFAVTLPNFAAAVVAVETNQGLPSIASVTQPVPQSIQTSLLSQLAIGSGPNGTLTLFDFLGAAAGVPYANTFAAVTGTINQLQSAGALNTLTDSTDGVYQIMLNALDGDYTTVIDPGPPEDIQIVIPSPLPGAGTYASLDDAFVSGLIPAAQNLISNIANVNSGAATFLNSQFNFMAEKLVYETTNLDLIGVDFTELTPSVTALLSIGTNLHDIGTDVGPNGQNGFFTLIADTTNIYGQAVIASLREGRNIEALNTARIELATQIPLDL